MHHTSREELRSFQGKPTSYKLTYEECTKKVLESMVDMVRHRVFMRASPETTSIVVHMDDLENHMHRIIGVDISLQAFHLIFSNPGFIAEARPYFEGCTITPVYHMGEPYERTRSYKIIYA